MIVLDIETTGVYPEKNSMVSIGAVDFSKPENQFYAECRIWEGAEITQEALNINGFTKEQITNTNKHSLEEAVGKFIQWMEKIEDKTLAGENPSFDRDFLKNSVERCGINYRLGHRIIDLHSLSYAHHLKRGLIPPAKNGRTDLNLNKTLVYVGLPSEPKSHNALTGAKMEAEAFSRLIYGKNLLPEFEKYKIPDYLK
ncbi:MAG: 3'-5' exonuclease [Nanoarchaeota archaeon]